MSVRSELQALRRQVASFRKGDGGDEDDLGAVLMRDVREFQNELEAEARGEPESEEMGQARLELALWHWFIFWNYLVECRRQLAVLSDAHQRQDAQRMIDRFTAKAEEARSEWERRGLTFEEALEIGRAEMSRDVGTGPSLRDEQIEAVVQAIRENERAQAR